MWSWKIINIEIVYMYSGINAIKGNEAEFVEKYLKYYHEF